MPGNVCSVAVCKNTSNLAKDSGQEIMFFTFPKDLKVRKQWVLKCNRKDKLNPSTGRICDRHFVKEDFEDALKAELLNLKPKKLKKTAVPSQNLLSENVKKVPRKKRSVKYPTKRSRRKILAEVNIESDTTEEFEEGIVHDRSVNEIEELKVTIKILEEKNETLQNQNETLKQNVKCLEDSVSVREKQIEFLNRKLLLLEKTLENVPSTSNFIYVKSEPEWDSA